MANDNLKAKLAEYDAAYAKNCEKVPARQNLPEQVLIMNVILDFQDSILTLVVCNLLCTVAVSGQCVCMLVSQLLKSPTNVTVT